MVRSFHRGAAETNPAGNHEVVGSIPGLVRGGRIQNCCELCEQKHPGCEGVSAGV